MTGARVINRELIGRLIRAIIANNGVSGESLAGSCEVNKTTVKKYIYWLREVYGAPITSDRNGYHWRPAPHEKRRAEALVIVFCE